MKGWRTIAYGLALVVVPPAITYLAGVDWSQYVPPNVAVVISGVITIALRMVTTTTIGKAK